MLDAETSETFSRRLDNMHIEAYHPALFAESLVAGDAVVVFVTDDEKPCSIYLCRPVTRRSMRYRLFWRLFMHSGHRLPYLDVEPEPIVLVQGF